MRCTAHNRSGDQCGNDAIKGGTVCRMHGGSAPQVRAKAIERLKETRDAATELLIAKIETKSRDADARVMLATVRDLSELIETMEGRVARREGRVNENESELDRDIAALLAEHERRAEAGDSGPAEAAGAVSPPDSIHTEDVPAIRS